MEEDEFSAALGIGPDADIGVHHRQKTSFRGISTRQKLRILTASAVDQDFLDEICELKALEQLTLEWPVTAASLAGLPDLRRLWKLRIDSPRNVTDFTPITGVRSLTHLDVENAKHMADLRWIRPLRERLTALGIDGSINTAQKIESLDPLDGFDFEELTLTNVSVQDKDLSPLINCRKLRRLRCAKSVSTFEGFMALADARPDMACDWFSPEHWPGRKWRR